VDEVADRLQRKFLLVSALSGTVFGSGTWLVDCGATCHMTGTRDLFEIFTEFESDLYVELGIGTSMQYTDLEQCPFGWSQEVC
jgi:hypothetical protein